MGKFKIRHLVSKPQKGGHILWYWQPAAALRALGFLPRRLADPSNDFTQAVREAETLNAEADAARAGSGELPAKPGTLPWLVRLYRSDPRYTALAEKTQDSYDWCIGQIEAWSGRAHHPPIEAFERKHISAFYRAMHETTPAKAAAIVRVLRILFGFALNEGLISRNPAERMRLKSPAARQAVWSAEQIAGLVAAAAAEDRKSIGLAVLLAANLGQREADVLRLAWSQFDGQAMQSPTTQDGAPDPRPGHEGIA